MDAVTKIVYHILDHPSIDSMPGLNIEAISAFVRQVLDDERHAAAEAMRERCAQVAKMCASTPPYDGIDETALYIGRSIERLPLDERGG